MRRIHLGLLDVVDILDVFHGGKVDVVRCQVVRVSGRLMQGDRVVIDGSSVGRGDGDEDTVREVEVECCCGGCE